MSLAVDIEKKIYVPTHHANWVGNQHGKVRLGFDGHVIELTTPAAHSLGMTLIRKSDEARQECAYVVFKLNGVSFSLLSSESRQLGGKLLIHADRADDYQRILQ